MPTYDYKCPKCNEELIEIHKMFDENTRLCPKCNEKMLKQFKPCLGVHFKGTGFYETDYKGK